MTSKSPKKNSIQLACAELESALEEFKTIQVKKKPIDEDQIEKVKMSLERIKQQLEEFS